MTEIALATATMSLVVERMLRDYPFYAAIINAGIFRAEQVGTLAVTIRSGRLMFLFDPRFVLAQSLDLLMGGLHHEVLHVLHGHLLADQSLYPDRDARIVAEEVTCNEFIREPLPPGVLRHRQFGLPDDEDTEKRYERLAATNPSRGKSNSVPTRPDSGPNAAGSVPSGRISFDDHSVWAEPGIGANGAAILATVMATAVARMSPKEWATVPPSIRARAQAILAGGNAVTQSSNVIRPASTSLSWPNLLAQVERKMIERVPTFGRPNRRFPELVGIMPGSRIDAGRPHVLAVIDSSGSVTDPMLSTISAELTALSRYSRVTICECDTRIHRTYPYTGPVTNVVGRGGTDLRPPFDPEYLKGIRPDLILVFTDGGGPAPQVPPRVPVIWVVMSGGRAPVPWGRIVRV
jgi:predicted metal-dependent peptidase